MSLIYTRPHDVRVYEYRGQTEPVFYQKHGKKVGLAENFMLGVENSKTKYICRMDDDENSLPFSDALMILKNHSEIKAVHPIYHIVSINEMSQWTLHNIVPYPQGAGIVYDREAFLSIGGYDTSLDYQADLDFYIRFVLRWGCMMPYAGVYYWNRNGENRSLNDKVKVLEVRKSILNKYGFQDSDVPQFGMYAYVRS